MSGPRREVVMSSGPTGSDPGRLRARVPGRRVRGRGVRAGAGLRRLVQRPVRAVQGQGDWASAMDGAELIDIPEFRSGEEGVTQGAGYAGVINADGARARWRGVRPACRREWPRSGLVRVRRGRQPAAGRYRSTLVKPGRERIGHL